LSGTPAGELRTRDSSSCFLLSFTPAASHCRLGLGQLRPQPRCVIIGGPAKLMAIFVKAY
jgi:hypothetical protein